MAKKFILVAFMLLLMPALASAGLIIPLVATGNSTGSITPPGTVFVTTAKTYTLTAVSGYRLNYVTKNGVTVPSNNISGSGPWTYVVPLSSSTQTVNVYFKLIPVPPPTLLIARAPANVGVVLNTPQAVSGQTSTISYLQPGTKAKFKWTSNPAAGAVFNPISSSVTSPVNILTSFTASALGTYTATLMLTAPGAAPSSTNVVITVQPPGVAASSFCLSCHNGWAEATAYSGSAHAASAKGPSCQSCHNPGIALTHPGYSTSNTTAKPGLFYSCVTCHFPGSNIVTSWPPNGLTFHNAYTGTNQCVNCHNPHNPGIVTGGAAFPHFSTYSTAQFVTTNISCNNCHVSAVDNSFNIFPANLEFAKSGHGNPFSLAYIGPGPYTEANLEAADYKFLGTPLPATPATTVSNDCVRCHTTTGYINYVTPLDTNLLTDPDRLTSFSDIHAWGTPGDRTREMVACPACHTPTPFSSDFSRRTVGIIEPTFSTTAVQAWYNYSSATTRKIVRSKIYNNTDGFELTDSNICIACHSGKSAGNLIKQTLPNNLTNCASQVTLPSIVCRLGGGVTVTSGLTHAFWSNVDFIDPHGMASASIMMPDNLRAGYEYRLATTASPAHTTIALGSTQGPCVGCHMSAPRKHVFSPVSSASNGVITAITSPLCSTCHGVNTSPIDAGFLETKKEGYQAALTVITAQLAAKGVYFNATNPPYFFTTAVTTLQGPSTRLTNWNAPAPLSQGANLMGAAFNLRLMQSDGGWVHNPTSTKRLLYDTIDYLDDGLQNDTVATTIQNLAGVDQTTRDRATAYVIPRP